MGMCWVGEDYGFLKFNFLRFLYFLALENMIKFYEDAALVIRNLTKISEVEEEKWTNNKIFREVCQTKTQNGWVLEILLKSYQQGGRPLDIEMFIYKT